MNDEAKVVGIATIIFICMFIAGIIKIIIGG